MAEWLNNSFAAFDGDCFSAMHGLAEAAGGFFTPFFKIVSVIGEKGIIFFFVAIALMMFLKTRKQGACMFVALCVGAIITKFILKDAVARERPYLASETFLEFWQYVNGSASDSYCFPSGHATMIAAAMTVLFICFNKKWSWTGFLCVILMCFSRVYLIAHYTTDVIGGVLVGALSAGIAFFIVKYLFAWLEKHKNNKLFAFCLSKDVTSLFKKKTQMCAPPERETDNAIEKNDKNEKI